MFVCRVRKKKSMLDHKREKYFIECFRQNDYSCFDEFYELTSKQIYFTAFSILKDNTLAQDVMQETYITFLEKIDGYVLGSNIFAYLTVIARNKSINIYNKGKQVVFDEEKLVNVASDEYESSSEIKEILSHLDSQLEREIVVYHVLLGYKFKEIATVVNEPLGTVLWRYNKALKTLRARVKEYE